MKILRDSSVVLRQQLGMMLRSPTWVIIGIVQPVLYLLLFAPLLRTALHASSTASAYASFVPGLLVLLVMGASLYAGVGLINEVRTGVIDRCRVTAVSKPALLLGRVGRDMVVFLAQALIVVAIAVATGLRANAAGVAITLLLLAGVSATVGSLSYLMALRARHEGAMSGMLGLVTQPLLLLSGVMLPLSLAPRWLRDVAACNPFSYLVDGSRDLFHGNLAATSAVRATVITVVLAVLVIAFSSRRFARSAG